MFSIPYYQIWINKKGRYELAHEMKGIYGAGQVSFADINGDGAVDLVFSVCTTSCAIHIVYNQQMSVCQSSKDTNCRQRSNLCQSDPEFVFEIHSSDPSKHLVVNKILGGDSLVVQDFTLPGIHPVPIRLGDYNNDGFIDMLVLLNSGSTGRVYVGILENFLDGSFRNFSMNKVGNEISIGRIISAAFLDIDDDGALDIIATVSNPTKKLQVVAFMNTLAHDAFFLKGLVLNGVCMEYCEGINAFPDPKPYGVSYPGATFKYAILDNQAILRVVLAAQLSQSAYMSMQYPNTLVGLGQTNVYVENLFVGVNRHAVDHVAIYPGIIPNSQLIISPFDRSLANPSNWGLELYMNPSTTTSGIIMCLLLVLLILGVVIFMLDVLENRQDENERKEKLHQLNFDAL